MTDGARSPLEGVTVTAYTRGGQSLTARSDGNGSYSLTALPDAEYDILFRFDSNPPLSAALYRIPSGALSANATLTTGRIGRVGRGF